MNTQDYISQKNQSYEHFWYKGRKELIEHLLSKKFKNYSRECQILDIGCGTGAELNILKKFGNVTALDADKHALEIIKKQNCQTINDNIEKIDLEKNKYDAICCFDVLEHLENDSGVINNIYSALKKDGIFFFTVPAFQFLFSTHDFHTGHKRRYNKKNISKLLKKSGFFINTISYWNIILFPLIVVIRITKKLLLINIFKKNKFTTDAKPVNKYLNKILYKILNFENYLIKKNISLPLGLTIYGVAQKKL